MKINSHGLKSIGVTLPMVLYCMQASILDTKHNPGYKTLVLKGIQSQMKKKFLEILIAHIG